MVDITQGDFNKANGKQKSRIIMSILSKCSVKNDNEEFESEVSAYYFNKIEPGSSAVSKITLDEYENGGGYVDFFPKALNDGEAILSKFFESSGQKNGFLIAPSSNNSDIPKKISDGRMEARKNGQMYLIMPVNTKNEKESILSSEWIIYSDKPESSRKQVYETTLGGIAALATTKFGDLAIVSDASAGKPQNIAKALGYEIPENYAPKQGVEPKK